MKDYRFAKLFVGSIAIMAMALLVTAWKGQRVSAHADNAAYILALRFYDPAEKKDFLTQEITIGEANPFNVVTAVKGETYTVSGKVSASEKDRMLDIAMGRKVVLELFPDGQVRTRATFIKTQVILEVKGKEIQIGMLRQPVSKDPKANLDVYVSLRPAPVDPEIGATP